MAKTYHFRLRSFIQLLSGTTLFFFIFFIVSNLQLRAQDLDVPYVPTPKPVVERMLKLGQVAPGEYVIDLGSGDGRIVIAAAKKGATGHGIDLDPARIREARENANSEEVSNRVLFVNEDLFKTDFSQASVVTMYLLSSVNRKLRPVLLEELRPGTRVVSHSFDMGDWKADSSEVVQSAATTGKHYIYLWIIPADAAGDWEWKVDNNNFSLNVMQEYQQIDIELRSGNRTLDIEEKILRGKRISFFAKTRNRQYVYSGRIDGDMITGTVQVRTGNDGWVETWTARRR